MSINYHLCFVDSLRTWGGAEVWLLETAQALRGRGHRVSIVAQPGSELLARARAAGVPVAAIPIRFDTAPWTLAQLTWYFRRSGVTALFTNRTKDLKAAGLAGRMAGVPVILSARESDFPLKDKAYYRWYFNHIATGLVAASQATRRTLLASAPWLDSGRIHLLPKGIDTERFHPAAVGPERPTAGFVGQLIERKGLPELMEAWSRIDAEPRIVRPCLMVAGEGELAEDLARWREQLEHPEQVTIAGFVEDAAAFYRKISLLVMPSRTEGFGLSAAEALASGVPVIAGRASSLPEIVDDGETGLLVPPRDGQALAQSLSRLLFDPGTARRWGETGRRRIQERFPLQRTLDDLLNLTGGAAPSSRGDHP